MYGEIFPAKQLGIKNVSVYLRNFRVQYSFFLELGAVCLAQECKFVGCGPVYVKE